MGLWVCRTRERRGRFHSSRIREAKEEIGIDVLPGDFILITQNKSPSKYHHRAICLLEKDIPLGAITFKDGEVADVKYIPWRELAAMSDKQKMDNDILVHTEFAELFEYLEKNGF